MESIHKWHLTFLIIKSNCVVKKIRFPVHKNEIENREFVPLNNFPIGTKTFTVKGADYTKIFIQMYLHYSCSC